MDASTIGRPTIDNETHGEGAGRTQEERAYCPNDDYSKKNPFIMTYSRDLQKIKKTMSKDRFKFLNKTFFRTFLGIKLKQFDEKFLAYLFSQWDADREYGEGDTNGGFKGSPIVLMIGYLGRLNIDGKGMMWDKKKSRIGAWQQQFIDKAISANRRPDGTFGAAELGLSLICCDDGLPITNQDLEDKLTGNRKPGFRRPRWQHYPSSSSESSGSDLEDRLTGNREPLIKRPRWQHFPSFSTESSGSALDSMDYKKAKNGAGFKCPPETISRWRSCRTGDATEMRPEGEAPKESANTRRISRNKAPSKRIPTSPEDTIRNSPAATNLPRRSPRNKDPAVTISRTGDAAEMRPEGEAPQESAPKRRSSGNKALSERIPMSPADTIQNSPTTTNIPRRSPRIKNPAMMISKQKRC